ncbi:MAG: family 43 glycosylhydrolase [Bacteroidaceae bacterium]|nr:family 43 glycosylhydrolase [Bacteroidaceae bacterium]
MKKTFLSALLWLTTVFVSLSQVTLTLRPDNYSHDISAAQYGIFLEEINHAVDGGLWSEMVSNRSFEDNESYPDRWWNGDNTTLSIATDNLMNAAQQQYLHVTPSVNGAIFGNNGYWGMRLDGQDYYTLTFYARADAAFSTILKASLLDYSNGNEFLSASKEITVDTKWQKISLTIPDANRVSGKAYLSLQTTSVNEFDIDVVSLMPAETYKGHGCRKDLAQMLEDLKPRFMRFPGGCYVEGQYSNGYRNRFEWKKTIGPIENRPGHWNINWNYRSSDAFGFHEMLQLSEDLGAVPLFVVNVGLGHGWYQNINYLDEFIQEALDAIEYANGATTTTWGAKRAANGHPEPFGLKYIEIGNENYNYYTWSNNDQSYQYPERYYMFYQAIKAKYPDIVCIGNVESWGTDNPSWRNDYPVDAVDEHYYRSPSWFASNYEKYDTYDRSGPKIYPGEYAVTSDFGTTGNLAAALGEAIYMQGMERNSDIVTMASYAPIFVNENDPKWMPDMIRFDATYSYGTPSYYVQKLMSQKLGTRNITWTEKGNNGDAFFDTYAGLSTWLTSAVFSDYKIYKDGVLVYSAPFDGTDPWTDLSGTFYEEDGTLVQTSTTMEGLLYLNNRVDLGDNYDIEVKATKTDGKEGFLIAFGYKDAKNYCWWNIGGWNNSQHAIEVCTNGAKTQYSIKSGNLITGRTYDLHIEVRNNHIKCYIDGTLYHDVILPMERCVYTSASREGDKLYVKLVNFSNEDCTTTLITSGYTASNIRLTQMKGETGLEENTASNMYNVVPQEKTLAAYGTNILVNVPAHSFNIYEMDISEGEMTDIGLMPEEGTYYLKDCESGQYLARGADWGTRATLSTLGIPVAITSIQDDIYTIRYRDLNAKLLGNLSDPYTDVNAGEETLWRFRDAGNGKVYLESTLDGKYFTSPVSGAGAEFTDDISKATAFTFVTSSAYEKYIAAMNSLTEETHYSIGADVTNLVTNPSMADGIDGWENTVHTYTSSGTIPIYQTPTNRVFINETFEKEGGIFQTVSGLTPNGIYRLTIPAFFRASDRALCVAADGEGLQLGNAYIICGDAKVRMKTWAEDRTGNISPDNMEEAAECFNNGLYQNVVTGHADDQGQLIIGLGVAHRKASQWLIWGGVKLEELQEPIDYTDNIINPSFEDNFNGWTNNGMQRQNNNESRACKTGTYYCEQWTETINSLPDVSVVQVVTGLKDGDYLVTATCHAERQGSDIAVSGVYLMAGDNKTAVTATDTYHVIATAVGGNLTIGFGCNSTDANWITVDNFQMKWIGSSAESNKTTLLVLIDKLQNLIDTKEILPLELRDEAAGVISQANTAETDEEVLLAIDAVAKKYEELDAYRIPVERNDNCNAYLFAYFPSNSDENLYYALSTDGYNYTPLNNGQKILNSWDFTLSGGIRDPHILRGEDGVFRMVNTDMRSALGWASNRGIVMSKSTDLIHWTHSTVHFPTRFPDGWSSVTRVWAPETVYDRETGKYMVYFSLLTSDDGTCNYDKLFYCYANDDFTDLEDYPVHLFDRGSATIDADIIFDETDQLYHMIYKNEGINSISHITAKYLTAREGETTGSQWGELGGAIQQTNVAVEGGGIFRLIDTNIYVVMYDCYGSGYYQFCSTTDWKRYTLVAQTAQSGMFTPRHGSVTPLHPAETRALIDAFPTDGFDIDCGDLSAVVLPAVKGKVNTSELPVFDLSGHRLPDEHVHGIYIRGEKKYRAK